jgi:hypothetical protein
MFSAVDLADSCFGWVLDRRWPMADFVVAVVVGGVDA